MLWRKKKPHLEVVPPEPQEALEPSCNRGHGRTTTAVPAIVRIAGSTGTGIVGDYSPGGVFLRGPIVDELVVGKELRITFVVRVDNQDVRISSIGAVRWKGKSAAHNCEGVGVCLYQSQPMLRARPNRSAVVGVAGPVVSVAAG